MQHLFKHKKDNRLTLANVLVAGFILIVVAGSGLQPTKVYALKVPPPGGTTTSNGGGSHTSNFTTGDNTKTPYQCGSGKNAVNTTIDIGCKGASCQTSNPDGCNAMTDAVFAIIRALSVGVGLVIVASMVWAGIQYTASRDDPSAVGKAKERIQNNLIALLVYVFAYAILNYLIPKGFFG
jgi:Type IV secretion system pilin